MAIAQEQADKFCQSLKSFHESLPDDEKQVLEQLLDQAGAGQEASAEGKPFFDKFLVLNPEGPNGPEGGPFVTLKFPSDSDESDRY